MDAMRNLGWSDIIYPVGKFPKDGHPNCVMVEFQQYTGLPFIQENPKLVPITPVQRKVDCFCYGCKIIQIPLRLYSIYFGNWKMFICFQKFNFVMSPFFIVSWENKKTMTV
jgi:hypothetical protein